MNCKSSAPRPARSAGKLRTAIVGASLLGLAALQPGCGTNTGAQIVAATEAIAGAAPAIVKDGEALYNAGASAVTSAKAAKAATNAAPVAVTPTP